MSPSPLGVGGVKLEGRLAGQGQAKDWAGGPRMELQRVSVLQGAERVGCRR